MDVQTGRDGDCLVVGQLHPAVQVSDFRSCLGSRVISRARPAVTVVMSRPSSASPSATGSTCTSLLLQPLGGPLVQLTLLRYVAGVGAPAGVRMATNRMWTLSTNTQAGNKSSSHGMAPTARSSAAAVR